MAACLADAEAPQYVAELLRVEALSLQADADFMHKNSHHPWSQMLEAGKGPQHIAQVLQ